VLLRGGSYRAQGMELVIPNRGTDSDGRHATKGARLCADLP